MEHNKRGATGPFFAQKKGDKSLESEKELVIRIDQIGNSQVRLCGKPCLGPLTL